VQEVAGTEKRHMRGGHAVYAQDPYEIVLLGLTLNIIYATYQQQVCAPSRSSKQCGLHQNQPRRPQL
jgi:hypothetical protein